MKLIKERDPITQKFRDEFESLMLEKNITNKDLIFKEARKFYEGKCEEEYAEKCPFPFSLTSNFIETDSYKRRCKINSVLNEL